MSKEKLAIIWVSIYQDYADAISGDIELAISNHVRKISLTEFKISKTTAILQYIATAEELGEKLDQEIIGLLIHMGAADSRMPEGDTLQTSWFKRIAGRIKRWQSEVDFEVKALTALKQTQQLSGESTTRESFQDLIIQIEKYVKYHINARETTVARFLAMIKDYQRYLIAQKKNKK